MGRPYRLEFPGATYYVTARAHRRECLFRDDTDYQRFTAWLGVVCTRYGWQCHAYSLLPTRYALLLRTRDANLARGMRQLNGVYSQAFNRRYGLTGPLFIGRYAAQPFEPTRDLLKVARHVLRAPVSAGFCRSPAQWAWSSYATVIDEAAGPDWLVVEPVLAACAGRVLPAREVFTRYIDALDPKPEWPTLKPGGEGATAEQASQIVYQRPPAPPSPDRKA